MNLSEWALLKSGFGVCFCSCAYLLTPLFSPFGCLPNLWLSGNLLDRFGIAKIGCKSTIIGVFWMRTRKTLMNINLRGSLIRTDLVCFGCVEYSKFAFPKFAFPKLTFQSLNFKLHSNTNWKKNKYVNTLKLQIYSSTMLIHHEVWSSFQLFCFSLRFLALCFLKSLLKIL